MAKHMEHEIVYHYDLYPTEEDLMGETSVHADLVHYLIDVLRWHFRGQMCAVYENLNFYRTSNEHEYPLAPDIAVIKGVEFKPVTSWSVFERGVVPQVVFEIASKETWKNDLKEKPVKYALMGVQEYFAYDPNQPPLHRKSSRRLLGWQIDSASHQMHEMLPGPGGRLWSFHLDSWLVPDGAYLRLYDRQGQLRLTGMEAEAEARRTETQRAEAEAQRVQKLAEKLRSLGIDPDQI